MISLYQRLYIRYMQSKHLLNCGLRLSCCNGRAFNISCGKLNPVIFKIQGHSNNNISHHCIFASQLIMKGGSIKDVQELLSHKTMTMTLRYAHLTQEHKRKAVNLLNGLTAYQKVDCHKTVTNPFQEKCASL